MTCKCDAHIYRCREGVPSSNLLKCITKQSVTGDQCPKKNQLSSPNIAIYHVLYMFNISVDNLLIEYNSSDFLVTLSVNCLAGNNYPLRHSKMPQRMGNYSSYISPKM